MSDELTPREPATGATLACAAGIAPERLSAWRDGLLPADEAEWLTVHTTGCSACGARLRDYDQIGAALRGQRIPQPVSDPWAAMQHRLAGERRGRRLPAPPAWRSLGALVAAALLVALFAGLLAHQATLRPTADGTPTQATATPTIVQATATPTVQLAAWTTVPGYQGLYNLSVAPSDPRVAYQLWNAADGAPLIRRTDDQGATWHTLTLPAIAHASYPVIGALSYFVASPFDSHVVYLIIEAAMNPPITSCASNGGGDQNMQYPLCRYQYISLDSGEHWSLLSLPVVGGISSLQGQRDTSGQSASTRLYSQITTHSLTNADLARSDDGGVHWRLIDTPMRAAGQNIAEYSATPDGTTIFALTEPAGTQVGTFPSRTIWRSDDAGASWVSLGQTPGGSTYSMQAALAGDTGKPLLYLASAVAGDAGVEKIQGSLSGASGSFATAPDTYPSCSENYGSEFIGARADGSVIIWCSGPLQSWLVTQGSTQNGAWRTLTQDPATSTVVASFLQTLPDGSTGVWLVIADNTGARVEYATLPN